MATHDFSSLIASADKLLAFSTSDFLVFDDSIRACDLIIDTVGSDITLRRATGNTLTLQNFAQTKIASSNFVFADGSKLIIGDGKSTTTNDANTSDILVSSDGNDYLDGVLDTDSGDGLAVNTASYAAAGSAVTVDLANTNAQNTIGAGTDKLLNIQKLIGSVFNDTLYGDANANVLDGGANMDVMDGKNGDDTYYATAGDQVSESASTGIDVVYAGVDFTLGTNIENLILTGVTAVHGRGNSLANTMTGNSANNVLDGGSGNDTFDGGLGMDTYIIDSSSDSITEGLTGGVDWAISTATFDLATKATGVENLRLIGTGNNNGTGNGLANLIIGNSGNNTLSGGDGNDTLTDLLGGNDILIGGAKADILIGGAGADTLTGGSNATTNDDAADILTGGTGNDTYNVTDASDTVNEAANAGTDLVNATVSYALNDTKSIGAENLTLGIPASGTTHINGTGNSLNNTLTGNTGNNTLIGGKGADSLLGANGNDILTGGVDELTSDGKGDTLTGGAGDDTYNVTDNTAGAIDVVVEAASQGMDLVNSTVSFALNDTVGGSVGVENLTLKGMGNINGTGNSLANTITGNSGNNTLNGGAGLAVDTLTDTLGGNDILDGGAGIDKMSGGIGNDTYYADTATENIIESPLQGTDLVIATLSFTITDVDIENLTLAAGSGNIDGTGNISANTLVGNDGNNKLTGGDGSDYLQGGAGNDTLMGGSRGAGSIASDGTPDADTMVGGSGDDTYWVDFETDNVIEELGLTNGTDEVISRVSFTIADADIEKLTLTGTLGAATDTNALNGTGNSSANTLTGNAGNNTLSGLAGIDNLVGNAGDDILDGGTGADIMAGGAGKDTYIVETSNTAADNGDQISETGADVDLVQAYATYTIFDTNVENLTLMGVANISGTGNNSANVLNGNEGGNTLIGEGGNDTLDGKEGADILKGGTGQDTYYVDAGDTVDESSGDAAIATTPSASLDTVLSTVTFAIDNDTRIENLSLLGTSPINGTGNSSANIMKGNAGNNTLDAAGGNDILNGGAGKDTLIGGTGTDTYVFTLATESSLVNFDVITDFKASAAAEKIDLSAIDALTLAFGISSSASATSVSAVHTIDYYVSSGNTFLIADTDGNAGTIDFKLQLTGFTGLVTGDIIK